MSDFILPELGENVTSGDVLRVLVKPGDAVAVDQPVIELETDKATIEVPSSVAGVVKAVAVKPGDKVKIGQTIFTFDAQAGAPQGEATPAPKPAPKPATEAAVVASKPASRGPGPDGADRKPPAVEAPVVTDKVVDISRGARAASESSPSELPAAPAAPSVRRMARELGIDIADVRGSSPGGRVSLDDVTAHAKRVVTAAGRGTVGSRAAEGLPDFSRWGNVERRPMNAVRRKTAQHLGAAWAAVPHVTQQDRADITALEELRKRYAKQVEAAGGHLTITAIAVKVVAAALKVFPQFNASIDEAAGEIVYKQYVNVGVAVDTDRGLLVPVVRDADTKNIVQLSVELAQLSEKARTRKIALDEMQGGCFSVSNLGGIGGSFFTPIVNVPEVAILGISRARMEPVFIKETGGFVPRLLLPLSLSYDHRVIDGADGARFLRWIVEAFEEPFVLALQG